MDGSKVFFFLCLSSLIPVHLAPSVARVPFLPNHIKPLDTLIRIVIFGKGRIRHVIGNVSEYRQSLVMTIIRAALGSW